MPESEERESAIVSLLRQFSLGLSAYRLFPGNLEQPGFTAAAERIREAAVSALAEGPVEVEVQGGRFLASGRPLPEDEQLERLALACYERGAERLLILQIPETDSLARLFDALSVPVAEAMEAGGAPELLDRAGEDRVVLEGVRPQAGTLGEGTTTEEELPDPGTLAEPVISEGGTLAEMAAEILARFRHFIERLPLHLGAGPDGYVRLHDALAMLPPDVRRAVVALLIEQALDDPFAERLVGTMTDTELAHAIATLDEGDPVAVARRLVDAGRRREGIIELTAAIADEVADASLREAEVVGASGQAASRTVATTVTDLLSHRLADVEQLDVRAIRRAFESEADERKTALEALQDYLLVERDLERIGRVLDVWKERIQDSLRLGDATLLDELLGVVEATRAALPDGDPERATLLEGYRRRILDVRLLREMVTTAPLESNEAVVSLLNRLGVTAVDALLDVLAEEQDRPTRLRLISLIAELGRGHHQRIAARLRDPRWYVARNAVTILHRSGGREVIPHLEQAASHRSAAVRREAVWGLFSVAGSEAVPVIKRLAEDAEETVHDAAFGALGSLMGTEALDALADLVRTSQSRGNRLRALEELASHPAAEAVDTLETLASRGARPRLAGRLRRRARALARQRHRERR